WWFIPGSRTSGGRFRCGSTSSAGRPTTRCWRPRRPIGCSWTRAPGGRARSRRPSSRCSDYRRARTSRRVMSAEARRRRRGAAMPGAGGTYLYLREAFQYRTGRLMPFLFIWTIMLVIPLIMSTGVIGLVQYLGYYAPDMRPRTVHGISLLVVAAVVFALYRK